MVRKEGNKWVVLNHDGTKVLGTYESKEQADKRISQIEMFKSIKEHLDKKKKK